MNNFNLIRLLAALSVAVCHLLVINSSSSIYSTISTVSVNSFFVISGLLIHKSANRLTTRRYLRNRIRRVFPALTANLLAISFALAPTVSVIQGNKYSLSNATVFFLKNLTLIPSWAISIIPYPINSPLGVGWNNPLWTLGFEFMAYLGILLIVKLFKKFQIIAIYFSIFCLGLIHASTSAGSLLNSGARLGVMFAFGIIVGQLRFSSNGISLFLVYIMFVGGFISLSSDKLMLNALLTSSLVLAFALMLPPLRMAWKGDYSYGIYIWHWPIFQFIFYSFSPSFSILVIQTVSLSATIILAILSYHGLEKRWLVSHS